MDHQIFTTESAEKTRSLGAKFSNTLKGGETICLYGELGSGKTTFMQGLAKGLGINKKIVSPTFILMRDYRISNLLTLYHLDLYRLDNTQNTKSLGLEELLNNFNNIICIEWAEKIKEKLPKKRIDIYFENIGEEIRKIVINTPNT